MRITLPSYIITPENESSAIPELQKCLRSFQDWMAASKLKLNPEFIIFGSPAQQVAYPMSILLKFDVSHNHNHFRVFQTLLPTS